VAKAGLTKPAWQLWQGKMATFPPAQQPAHPPGRCIPEPRRPPPPPLAAAGRRRRLAAPPEPSAWLAPLPAAACPGPAHKPGRSPSGSRIRLWTRWVVAPSCCRAPVARSAPSALHDPQN
jgi:hypothetical protein